ncbi:hypothetical protein Hdeb2414_s0009g00318551 [Helianthus debilis subsp. tardiflorus]
MALEDLEPQLPRFTGSDPNSWISQSELYFRFYSIYGDERFSYVIEVFEDEPFYWFNSWFRSDDLTWNDFTTAMLHQFCSLTKTGSALKVFDEMPDSINNAIANADHKTTDGEVFDIPTTVSALQLDPYYVHVHPKRAIVPSLCAPDCKISCSTIVVIGFHSLFEADMHNTDLHDIQWLLDRDSIVMASFAWKPGLLGHLVPVSPRKFIFPNASTLTFQFNSSPLIISGPNSPFGVEDITEHCLVNGSISVEKLQCHTSILDPRHAVTGQVMQNSALLPLHTCKSLLSTSPLTRYQVPKPPALYTTLMLDFILVQLCRKSAILLGYTNYVDFAIDCTIGLVQSGIFKVYPDPFGLQLATTSDAVVCQEIIIVSSYGQFGMKIVKFEPLATSVASGVNMKPTTPHENGYAIVWSISNTTTIVKSVVLMMLVPTPMVCSSLLNLFGASWIDTGWVSTKREDTVARTNASSGPFRTFTFIFYNPHRCAKGSCSPKPNMVDS